MRIFHTIAEIREFVRQARAKGRSIGFVPTMGYLHEGHLELMRQAKKQCGTVIISIFVNPTQFGREKTWRLPADLDRDAAMAEGWGGAYSTRQLRRYTHPDTALTSMWKNNASRKTVRSVRPGHFRAVATVVGQAV